MEAFQTMMIVYITISTACVIGCIVATLLVYLDNAKAKRASSAEIAHLQAEVRACRELLRRKESKGNA
ncbi:MAG: hypothetical protein IJT87_12400 [Ruminiclostridium sp.]|nr:hypothetical protein [Clostridia bacterium]MBQ9385024.1 hypothetical protein [Ruminiclostridium sp.]